MNTSAQTYSMPFPMRGPTSAGWLAVLAVVLVSSLIVDSLSVGLGELLIAFLLWDGLLSVATRSVLRLGDTFRTAIGVLPFAAVAAIYALAWAIRGTLWFTLAWSVVSVSLVGLGCASLAARRHKECIVKLSDSTFTVKDLLVRRTYNFEDTAGVKREPPSRLPFVNTSMGPTVLVQLKSTARPIVLWNRKLHLRIPEGDVDRFIADFHERLIIHARDIR